MATSPAWFGWPPSSDGGSPVTPTPSPIAAKQAVIPGAGATAAFDWATVAELNITVAEARALFVWAYLTIATDGESDSTPSLRVLVDGNPVTLATQPQNAETANLATSTLQTIAAGSHTITLQWKEDGTGVLTLAAGELSLLAIPAFTVDAGPNFDAVAGVPIALAGSASGGTPPYEFGWEQVSGPGTASFVSTADPTTNVTFDVAGAYILRLNGLDTAGSFSQSIVTATVAEAPSEFLLDNLVVQPLWAHHIGKQLRAGQTNLFRCRRSSDDAEQDFTVGDLVDIGAALNAFCGSGLGYLVTVYNAVAASPYPSISAPSTSAQALIYSGDEGGALLGDTGLLCARFDGTGLPSAADDGYQRDDSLGLAGDCAITIAGDLNDPGGLFCTPAAIGSRVPYPTTPLFATFMCFIQQNADYFSIDYVGGEPNGYAQSYAPVADERLYWQIFRDVGTENKDATIRINGVNAGHPYTDEYFVNSLLDLETESFIWGNMGVADYIFGGIYPIAGTASNLFVWGSLLGAGDQALIDAFQVASSA